MQVAEVVRVLEAKGHHVNASCGCHVHVGWRRDYPSIALARLITIVAYIEQGLYAITGSKARERRCNGHPCYAKGVRTYGNDKSAKRRLRPHPRAKQYPDTQGEAPSPTSPRSRLRCRARGPGRNRRRSECGPPVVGNWRRIARSPSLARAESVNRRQTAIAASCKQERLSRSGSRWFRQRLLNWPQAELAQCAIMSGSRSQQRCKGDMHHQHRADHRVKSPRADEVAIIDAPEKFQPGVHPLHRRATLVHPLELLGSAWNRRKPPQVDRAIHTYRLAVGLARIADRIMRAGPTFVPRRTAILDRFPLRFVTDVGHLLPHDRLARAIVAIDRARFVVGRFPNSIATAGRGFLEENLTGSWKPEAARGRLLSRFSTCRTWEWETSRKSVPLGKYWRIKPLVFSFVPRSYGQPGSAKYNSMPRCFSSRWQRANSVPLSKVMDRRRCSSNSFMRCLIFACTWSAFLD